MESEIVSYSKELFGQLTQDVLEENTEVLHTALQALGFILHSQHICR